MKTTDLKPLFWKEWHENIRWALLALLGLSLGLAYAEFRQASFPTLSQVWGDADLVLALAAPVIGLALGLLQILPELRRDQWAFLVHRPVSRTMLFFGKIIPGLCLYLLATILPLLVLALWASSPRHVPAPFDFRFTLGGWAAILSGVSFYFAGQLIALRPARWYGSRALPVLAALAGPWAAYWFTEFWQAALVCLLAAAVLLTAAWGSFVTGGDYKEQTKPARFALGLTLYPAVMAVGAGIVMLCVGAVTLLGGRSGSGEWWRNDYQIDTQGRIMYFSERGLESPAEHGTVTITDLAGRLVDRRVWENLKQQKKLLDLQYLPVKPTSVVYRLPFQKPERYEYLLNSNFSENLSDVWYYDSRFRQIVHYTIPAVGSPLIHYLGPQGYGESRNRAGQFPEGVASPNNFVGQQYLQFPHAVFWHNTDPPAVGLLQDTSDSAGILGMEGMFVADDPNAYFTAYFVVAAGQITVYAPANEGATPERTRRLFTTPLAYSGQTEIRVAGMPDLSRFFFWYPATDSVKTEHIVTVAADGRVLKTETLPRFSPPGTTSVKPPTLRNYAPALLFPPAVIPTLVAYGTLGHALGWSSAESFRNSRDDFGRLFLFSCITGLVAAGLAWRISRRCGDERRGQILWAFGVFWLGLYGVLLLLALREWPARVPCPQCRRLRVVDRTGCEHCGAQFARPVRDGTEIFEAESVEAESVEAAALR